jgi:hypothetical protein
MSMIIDGTNGLTFNNATTQASAGVVLQVVQATSTTQTTVASSTYTDVGLSVSITPKFATSKVLVFASVVADMQKSTGSAQGGGISIVRNSTTVWAPNPNGSSQPYTWYTQIGSGASIELTTVMNLNYLDSPATTSAITYKIQGAVYSTNNSGQIIFQLANATSNIIAMEIAG